MSNTPIPMNKLRQIIRFYGQGTSIREITSLLGTSRNTIRRYIRTFQSLDISYEQFFSMSDRSLSQLFSPPNNSVPDPRREQLEAMLPELCKRLKKRGMTRDKLHKEYIGRYPDGYSRSRFNHAIQLYLSLSKTTMHIDHKAGDKMYIDFAGDKLQLVSLDGTEWEAEVFVAILDCSQLTYVEAVRSQKKEDLIKACQNALHYFGGVPRAIVPDNLRSAVTRGSKYEAIINEEFASFAEHYGIAVVPARAHRPRDKALVEGAVKLVYNRIYPRLEGRRFAELLSINSVIRTALELYNNTPFTGRSYSRRDQFEEVERNTLLALNPLRYEIKKQAMATVHNNGHVRLGEDTHFYSVPHTYTKKKVKLLYTSQRVDIYYKYELIASHKRSYRRYQYTTDPEHLASNHRFVSEWTPERFLEEAYGLHDDIGRYIEQVLEHKGYPDLAYKACSGILSLERKVGVERLANACSIANNVGHYGFRAVEDILDKKYDLLEHEEQDVQIPQHENIRGKDYYQ